MKRFLVDWTGNYAFFVPLVIAMNGYWWHWQASIIIPYMLISIVISAVTGRAFTLFLKRVWYPLWRERF